MAESLISPGVLSREQDRSFIAPLPLEAGAAFVGPAVKGPAFEPTVVTSYGDYQRTFGTTFLSGSNKFEFLTSIAVKSYFEQGGSTALITRVVSGSFTGASNTNIQSEDGNGAPFQLQTLGTGVILNSSTNAENRGPELTAAVAEVVEVVATQADIDNSVIGADGEAVTAIGDIITAGVPAVAATYDSVENSDGSLKMGDDDNLRWEIQNVNPAAGTFSLLIRRGDDSTKAKTVLESFNDLSLDPNSEGYIASVIGDQFKSLGDDGEGAFLSTNGQYVNRSRYIRVSDVNRQTVNYLANDGVNIRTAAYTGSLPVASSGSFHGATGTNYQSDELNMHFADITNNNTQGLVAENYSDGFALLTNQDEYLFNIISAPGLIYSFGDHKTQLDSMISLAQDRGDAIAVVDLSPYGSSVAQAAGHAAVVNNSYAASYWPWVQVGSSTGKLEFAPASTIIPGVYAFTDAAAAPWFAPAGLTRGGIPNVIQAERKLTRAHRDKLYSANVNPIATFPGSGISVFGQKTLQKKKSALDRVNVRRLLIALKKFLGDQAKSLVFEQNTIATRNVFLSNVNPYLQSVVERQGLYAFRVIMDDSNNTADVIDRNQLVGQIFIQPAKTAEFITLDFVIQPTGATLGE